MKKDRKRNKGTRTARFIISAIIGFILTIVLTAMTYMLGLYLGFFNEGLILDHLNRNNYYNGVLAYTYDSGESIALPIGLPAEVFEDTLTLDMVYKDVRGYMEASFNGTAYEVDTTQLQENLAANVEAYTTGTGVVLTGEQKNNVTEFTKQIAADYTENVKMPFLSYFVKAKNFYTKILVIALPICLLVSVALGAVIFRLYRFKHRALRFITYSTIAAGFMSIILPAAVLFTRFYERLTITPEYFYEFVSTYVSKGIQVFLYLGAVWLVLSAGTIIATNLMRKSVMNN